MKNTVIAFAMLGTLAACSSNPPAQPRAVDADIKALQTDQLYCYGLASMANMTVLGRQAGKTLDEQMAQRKKTLGEGSKEYALVRDIAQQIYSNDIKDARVAISDTHASCMSAKGHGRRFTPNALRTCPAVGAMVAEVAAARRKGASVEQVSALVGERYGDLPKTYGGGLQKLATKFTESSPPDNGAFDYQTCMILGMTGN